jgi:hypothetical protein
VFVLALTAVKASHLANQVVGLEANLYVETTVKLLVLDIEKPMWVRCLCRLSIIREPCPATKDFTGLCGKGGNVSQEHHFQYCINGIYL